MNEDRKAQIADSYPLSSMQQGMLFHYLSEGQPGGDIEQIVCSLHETLNTHAFAAAWHRVVSRNAVFRTSFRWKKLAAPLQDVHLDVGLPFTELDWTNLSPAEQEGALAKFLVTDRKAGFDLSRAPNLRVMVAKLGAKQHACVWTFHHILLDGRSFPIVLNEVFAIYQALCDGKEVALPEPRPFRGYIDWLQRQDWSRAEAFWREKLRGFAIPTTLRTPRPDPESDGQPSPKADREIELPEPLTSALKTFAAENDVTLNTLVQGAWAILLSRYSGEEDVLFGTTRACRRSTVPGADNIVGIFINTVPLRVAVPPARTVALWLKELRRQEFELREHEHTPLIKIQQWGEVRGRKNLFESLIMFDHSQLNASMRQLGQVGENRAFELKEQVNHPLVLQAYGERRLLFRIEYSRAGFDEATVSRMLGHLQTVLAGMVAGAGKPIGSLPLLTEPERREVLFAWNELPTDYPSSECIHQLFEKQAARTPEAVALTCEGRSLTYRELNARSNRLARELRALGVGPDVLAGICMERSNDLVIGLLAILKAGGAYLPIDLAYPAERLAFMLADSQAPVLLTQSKLAKDLPATSSKVVCVDDALRQATTSSDDVNLPAAAGPDNLAYVIYTSGTTGKPKGSLITHRNVTRLFSATDHWYHFNERDVWTLFHSYAFDFSVWEIWGALLYGGRVIVVPFIVSRSPEAFYQLLAEERVTVLNQTPSAFRQLIQAEASLGQKELALRYVIFGGEALEMQSLRPWFDRHGDQQPRLVNMYGITETTVHVTYRPLSRDDVQSGSVIGVPIPDLQVYILDPQRQPLPVGVPGEMYVGGAGLARGYLNRPELTAERFIPDHITGRPAARLYRTGDLARFLPGRDIEYLGRVDSQVKIRGFRVELGEIESVLCQHPSVREAVVLAREDVPGNKYLAAYIVALGAPPPVKTLREHLKKQIPEYMVPAAYVFLDKIPLTTNGKADRKALPEPLQERADLGNEYVAPRSETERVLGRIWTEVLGVEKLSIQDDFFDLGGHSLMVLRAISLINERFKAQLPPAAMFEHRTIAGLAALLAPGHKADTAARVALGPESRAATADIPEPVARTAACAPASPDRAESARDPEVALSLIESVVARRGEHPRPVNSGRPFRMRESWIAKWVLAPLFRIDRGGLRRLIQLLILKLEGGDFFTVTLRKLYQRYYELHIGDYTSAPFDVHCLQTKTRIGRYTSISPTVMIRNADHPRNTISTNALFYNPAFGFEEGHELPRVKVEIANDVFIGHNAIILYPTTKIGDGAVIAAGSVVVEDVPPYAIVGGYPARVLRYRFSRETIEALLKSRWWEASLEELEPVKRHFALPLEGEEIR